MESLLSVKFPSRHGTVAGREDIVRHFGASSLVASEVLAYTKNHFQHDRLESLSLFPLPDEGFVADWEIHVREMEQYGFAAVAQWLVQLNFPIEPGMAQNPAYLSATRRAVEIANLPAATGIAMLHPQEIRLFLHPTWAGRIPVWVAGCRADFVSLVRAFSNQNEPVAIPESMGACFVSGYNNIARFREEKMQTLACKSSLEVKDGLKPYQDRFVILSEGPYSGLPAASLGLEEREWMNLSLIIRREHECAHYWTKRVLGSMRNCLLDEIIADCCGMVSATGRFRASWLLAFLGIERYPEVRTQGRIHNYRGTPALSDDGFALVQRLVLAAANNLERFHDACLVNFATRDAILMILVTLTRLSLEQLAAGDALTVLAGHLAAARCHLPHPARQNTNSPSPAGRQANDA